MMICLEILQLPKYMDSMSQFWTTGQTVLENETFKRNQRGYQNAGD